MQQDCKDSTSRKTVVQKSCAASSLASSDTSDTFAPGRIKKKMAVRTQKGKMKMSKNKLPVGRMRLLPVTAGICPVAYQGNGKYLTFNFLGGR